ncbi:10553_t:CDS:2 [Ambispora leptoticha]|uniref:10553_t:CDS:1 n=1 Tax=Ambispora leptoticha TaxID=144679 RepID=A0A9N9AFV0_9GLOM|nr:10553_t:CDS:2 [Ambispora leptoticha]
MDIVQLLSNPISTGNTLKSNSSSPPSSANNRQEQMYYQSTKYNYNNLANRNNHNNNNTPQESLYKGDNNLPSISYKLESTNHQQPYHHPNSTYRQNQTPLLSQQPPPPQHHHHPIPNQHQHLNVPAPPTHTHSQTPNRRLAHILSEQKRRENINSGFEELKNIVPTCRGHADSKAVILRKAVRYIQNLESEVEKLRQQNGNLSPKTGSITSGDSDASPDISAKTLSNGMNAAAAGNLGRNSCAMSTFNGTSPVNVAKNKIYTNESPTPTTTTHFYHQTKKASIEHNYQNVPDTWHSSRASLHTPSPISSAISSDEEPNYKNEDIEWKRSISPISNHDEDYTKSRPPPTFNGYEQTNAKITA